MPNHLNRIAVLVLVSLSTGLAHAALRSPQVPVSGTALQSFFTSQGQSINVNAAQQDLQSFSVPVGAIAEAHSFVPGSTSFGMYNAGQVAPALNAVLPGLAAAGWFADVSWRASPLRAVVNLFDDTSALISTNTYLGADNTSFGFYTQGPGGLFFTQDARNPGGAPRILVFSGTGTGAGSTWFACETGPGPGGDFADHIALIGFPLAPVPATQTSWSRVKSLYH